MTGIGSSRSIKAFQRALEFIGEGRGGISRESFHSSAISCSDALIALLRNTDEAREFVEGSGISRKYIVDNAREVLWRLHFNGAKDLFVALGLPRTASTQEVHGRWKELMLLYHPDRNEEDGRAVECAKKVNEAYSVLKDEKARFHYEKEHKVKAAKNGGIGKRAMGLEQQRSVASRSNPAASPSGPSFSGRRHVQKAIIVSCIALVIIGIAIFGILNMDLFSSTHRFVAGQAPGMRDKERCDQTTGGMEEWLRAAFNNNGKEHVSFDGGE
jgi:DnaJ domain